MPERKDGLAMTVEDVRAALGARVLVGEEHLDREVRTACGSDMMSDVLAFSKDHGVLLTGLVDAGYCLHYFYQGQEGGREASGDGQGERPGGAGDGPPDVYGLRSAL